jgi:uncharacterized protein DUF2314
MRMNVLSRRPVSRRTIVYIGIALGLLALGRLLSTRAPPSTPAATSSGVQASLSSSAPAPAPTLRRPPSSVATLGVLTDRPQADLDAIIDRDALAGLIVPKYCGDERACDAVRATLRDPHAARLQIMAASDWNFGRFDVDATAGDLSLAERASIRQRSRVVVVSVATATSRQQVAVRAAFAAAAAIAERIEGLVHDPLLSRVETSRAFATHAVIAPLEASAFRRDRVELLYEAKADGVVRVLTAGLSRWGVPDVEAAQVPAMVRQRVAEIVLAVGAAIADAAGAGPWVLSRDDIGRARGRDYPADAGLPPLAPVAIDLVSVHPEAGDPNDFIARIEPPAGDGPMGYIDLAERFFGPLFDPSPEGDETSERQAEAQRQLPSSLARWSSSLGNGAKLLIRLPFAIPGDAGVESMWVEVTHYDARTVTGKLVDEPLGATDVALGDSVTRPRGQVEAVRLTVTAEAH